MKQNLFRICLRKATQSRDRLSEHDRFFVLFGLQLVFVKVKEKFSRRRKKENLRPRKKTREHDVKEKKCCDVENI